jgi:hypothetical protein
MHKNDLNLQQTIVIYLFTKESEREKKYYI